MKRLIQQCMVLFIALIGANSIQAADVKVGVIDLHKIVQSSAEVKKIKKDLEGKFKPRQQKLLALQSEIKNDIQKLQRDAAVMTAKQKQELEEKIMASRNKMQKQGQAYQQELTMAQNQAMQGFFDRVKKIVDGIAKNEKYDLILQKEGVPFATQKMNITNKVIKKL